MHVELHVLIYNEPASAFHLSKLKMPILTVHKLCRAASQPVHFYFSIDAHVKFELKNHTDLLCSCT